MSLSPKCIKNQLQWWLCQIPSGLFLGFKCMRGIWEYRYICGLLANKRTWRACLLYYSLVPVSVRGLKLLVTELTMIRGRKIRRLTLCSGCFSHIWHPQYKAATWRGPHSCIISPLRQQAVWLLYLRVWRLKLLQSEVECKTMDRACELNVI